MEINKKNFDKKTVRNNIRSLLTWHCLQADLFVACSRLASDNHRISSCLTPSYASIAHAQTSIINGISDPLFVVSHTTKIGVDTKSLTYLSIEKKYQLDLLQFRQVRCDVCRQVGLPYGVIYFNTWLAQTTLRYRRRSIDRMTYQISQQETVYKGTIVVVDLPSRHFICRQVSMSTPGGRHGGPITSRYSRSYGVT